MSVLNPDYCVIVSNVGEQFFYAQMKSNAILYFERGENAKIAALT